MDERSVGTDTAMVTRSDDAETPEQAEMRRQMEAAIERDKLDPRQQRYMFNKGTGLLIRTNQQYHRALENRQQIEIISYAQAAKIWKREQVAKSRALNASKKKRKSVKQARKRNRP